jgi:hypothetical protein
VYQCYSPRRWPSRAETCRRLLRIKLYIFFGALVGVIISKLALLANIYQPLDTLNTRVSDPKGNILTSTDKLLAFSPNKCYTPQLITVI